MEYDEPRDHWHLTAWSGVVMAVGFAVAAAKVETRPEAVVGGVLSAVFVALAVVTWRRPPTW